MILTRDEILKEMKKKHISVEPFIMKNLGPASIDLTLGDKFRIFKNSKKVHDVHSFLDYKHITDLIEARSIIIKPQETILGVTHEKITLAPNICGWLEGRSRFARLGLMVHISAPFMQPGISNHPVLEITNMSSIPLRIHSGTPLCQFIFQKTVGKPTRYAGKFEHQREP